MEEISCIDRVEKKEKRNILHTIKGKKANRTDHILRRHCLLQHFLKEKLEGAGTKVRRCKQLLEGLMETRGYWKLKKRSTISHSG